MPLIGGLILLIQFSFAFHALKTGRPTWWMFVIMAFPVLGCVAYYFFEVFPGSREHRGAHKAARKLVRSLQPSAELKRRAEALAECGSMDNRAALARECLAHQMPEEAVTLLEGGLCGPFAEDASLLTLLARAQLEAGQADAAGQTLARLHALADGAVSPACRMLGARLAELRGEHDAALDQYQALVADAVGLEARYRLGALLQHLGRHSAASEVFDALLEHARRYRISVEDEQVWIDAARQALRTGSR